MLKRLESIAVPGISNFQTPGSIESFLGGSWRFRSTDAPGQITVSFWFRKGVQLEDWPLAVNTCRVSSMGKKETRYDLWFFTIGF